MGSSRLPGKSLMDLSGAPLVGRILERVKRCEALDDIVLATPDGPANDAVAALAPRYGVKLFRGSENDLLDRYCQAARTLEADVIVRLPADNPTPEPPEIDRIVRHYLEGDAAFSSNLSNVLGNGYPDGIGAEVFGRDVLEAVWRESLDPLRREHPHLNFFDYERQEVVAPERFPVSTVPCPAAFRRPDLVLDVNTQKEYEFMQKLYEYLYPRDPEFTIVDIIDWYDNIYWPAGGLGNAEIP